MCWLCTASYPDTAFIVICGQSLPFLALILSGCFDYLIVCRLIHPAADEPLVQERFDPFAVSFARALDLRDCSAFALPTCYGALNFHRSIRLQCGIAAPGLQTVSALPFLVTMRCETRSASELQQAPQPSCNQDRALLPRIADSS